MKGDVRGFYCTVRYRNRTRIAARTARPCTFYCRCWLDWRGNGAWPQCPVGPAGLNTLQRFSLWTLSCLFPSVWLVKSGIICVLWSSETVIASFARGRLIDKLHWHWREGQWGDGRGARWICTHIARTLVFRKNNQTVSTATQVAHAFQRCKQIKQLIQKCCSSEPSKSKTDLCINIYTDVYI